MTEKSGKEFTGRKMLIVTVSAFAVIIVVNLTMAYLAVGTFPGLEVKNSYVASQSFDEDRKAQEALGWDVAAAIEGTTLRLDITGPDDMPVRVGSLSVLLGRATHVKDDQNPTFSVSSTGAYVAEVGELGPGYWNLRLEAEAQDGTAFRQLLEIYLTES